MYFIAKIVLQYDGYEWIDRAILKANTKDKAIEQLAKIDFTHGNGIEVQTIYEPVELREEEYIILKRYL